MPKCIENAELDCKSFPRCDGCNAYREPTNADRIRAMDDELLATQFVQVVRETIEVLTKLEMPDSLLNEIRTKFLEKLKEPAEGE